MLEIPCRASNPLLINCCTLVFVQMQHAAPWEIHQDLVINLDVTCGIKCYQEAHGAHHVPLCSPLVPSPCCLLNPAPPNRTFSQSCWTTSHASTCLILSLHPELSRRLFGCPGPAKSAPISPAQESTSSPLILVVRAPGLGSASFPLTPRQHSSRTHCTLPTEHFLSHFKHLQICPFPPH